VPIVGSSRDEAAKYLPCEEAVEGCFIDLPVGEWRYQRSGGSFEHLELPERASD
jgi:hypothetical protein